MRYILLCYLSGLVSCLIVAFMLNYTKTTKADPIELLIGSIIWPYYTYLQIKCTFFNRKKK